MAGLDAAAGHRETLALATRLVRDRKVRRRLPGTDRDDTDAASRHRNHRAISAVRAARNRRERLRDNITFGTNHADEDALGVVRMASRPVYFPRQDEMRSSLGSKRNVARQRRLDPCLCHGGSDDNRGSRQGSQTEKRPTDHCYKDTASVPELRDQSVRLGKGSCDV